MECAYLVFEIRYSTILDFSNLSKKIVAPYTRQAAITIRNENSVHQTIQLDFLNDGFVCTFDYGTAILRVDTKSGNLILNENSALTAFFDILNKIAKLEEFGNFNNYLFEAIHLSEDNGILRSKESSIFGENLDAQIGFTNNQSEDFYESFLVKKYNRAFYDERHPLFPLSTIFETDLDNTNLIISRYKFFENFTKNEFRKKLKISYQKSQDLIKKLEI